MRPKVAAIDLHVLAFLVFSSSKVVSSGAGHHPVRDCCGVVREMWAIKGNGPHRGQYAMVLHRDKELSL